MSAREDFPWSDEAKNLKEGLPPNHKREPSPTPSPIQNKSEELSKAAEEWASQFKTGEWFEKLRIEAFKAGAQWIGASQPQPDNQDQEYWQRRCEAAEYFIATDDGWNEWLKLKSQQPK